MTEPNLNDIDQLRNLYAQALREVDYLREREAELRQRLYLRRCRCWFPAPGPDYWSWRCLKCDGRITSFLGRRRLRQCPVVPCCGMPENCDEYLKESQRDRLRKVRQ